MTAASIYSNTLKSIFLSIERAYLNDYFPLDGKLFIL